MWDLPFDELVLGSRASTRGRTVTEADVAMFSALTWDHHPVHTDVEWAAEREFGGLIAHGMLILSFGVGLLDLSPERVMAIRRLEPVVFRNPVRIGDTIHAEVRIAELEEIDELHGLVRSNFLIVRADGVVAVKSKADLVWRREPAAVAAAPAAA